LNLSGEPLFSPLPRVLPDDKSFNKNSLGVKNEKSNLGLS
jgi:hypothetical protein